jgi:hypothetical protein
MAQERIERRMILREGEAAAEFSGPLTLRAPAGHVAKLLEERISLGRRLAVLLLNNDSQWRDALQRLKTWNAFNASELARFIASPEATDAYTAAVSAPEPSTPPPDRPATFRSAVQAPLGVLLSFYARVVPEE